MKDLLLKDILNLTEDELNDAKLALNMRNDDGTFFDNWDKSDATNRNVSFSYYSHYGNKKNYSHIGQLVFGFVQLTDNNKKWLLVTVGKITSLPDHDTCDHVEVEKYQGLLGRLVIEFAKGNTYSRYVFNLATYIDQLKVSEILAHDYQAISFKGLDNVHLKFHDLLLIINGEKYADYRNALLSVKGVYCLTDTSNGKLYIGSAYGEHGVAQRWTDYLNTKTGNNKELLELYNEKGEKYFETNFEFTLLEYFGMNVDSNKIINRENYWKDAFDTRKHGYNKN